MPQLGSLNLITSMVDADLLAGWASGDAVNITRGNFLFGLLTEGWGLVNQDNYVTTPTSTSRISFDDAAALGGLKAGQAIKFQDGNGTYYGNINGVTSSDPNFWIDINGATLDTGSAIQNLWVAENNKLQIMDFTFGGSYGSSTGVISTQDYAGPNGYIVGALFKHGTDATTTNPKINIQTSDGTTTRTVFNTGTGGVEVTASSVSGFGVTADPTVNTSKENYRVEYSWEVKINVETAGSGTAASDLRLQLIVVTE